MPRFPVDRETFIALKARREALRVTQGMIHPPLDPHQFFCRHCGRMLDALNLDLTNHIRCEDCGWRTEVPASSAVELRRRRRRRWGRQPRTPLRDAVVLVYLLIALILLLSIL